MFLIDLILMNYIISSGNQEDGVKQNAFTH